MGSSGGFILCGRGERARPSIKDGEYWTGRGAFYSHGFCRATRLRGDWPSLPKTMSEGYFEVRRTGSCRSRILL